ncbi:phage holin family protein [Riemerella anatipestifer]|uniref:phage holin family protein n=1 Tax=Riemerella anatipestifer TaxID=34085 RepID=UPI001BD9A46A|nr:phage holin family protein [Riemerella anatipestifer]MBT0552280.1 phage holin family protein [Riemerella anatipestifer]MBT0554316.1 phage holin family protein [Riemerella anatipestifer]MCU7561000.1 phage holin family protein [Riemerella anatipestifer]MDY3449867.1 phage holin family protein [Riemerella anatipestifer]QYR03317.1 phage holin family protein [Riemerella anatipestifer]
MIAEILKQNYEGLYTQLIQVCFIWIAVLLAIIVDFYFGLKKAQEMGEATTSEGYRRTINKFVYYYSMMFFALTFDFLDVITPTILPFPLSLTPLFSVFCAIALIFTEAKSVREKAEDKVRRRADKSFAELLEVLQKSEDIVSQIFEHLKQQKNNENNSTTNS